MARVVRSRTASPLGTNGRDDEDERNDHLAAMAATHAPVDVWTALRRGWRGRCPRCGDGALFGGFLKMRSHCPTCAMVFEPYRADDAPAYFTIVAVGHIIVPLVLVLERYGNQPPLWFHAVLWLPLSVVLALLLLPRIKGAVISLLWVHRVAAPKPSAGGLDLSP
jgi:uncharacterized protein (DUF983 family)